MNKSNQKGSDMKFRPLHDRVLLERIDQDEKTAGGIIIPDTAKEKPMEGRVIATGSGVRSEDGTVHPLDVKAELEYHKGMAKYLQERSDEGHTELKRLKGCF